jgi:hypothetical protein
VHAIDSDNAAAADDDEDDDEDDDGEEEVKQFRVQSLNPRARKRTRKPTCSSIYSHG